MLSKIPTPLLATLMGLLVPIEPDHLCSLIAINAGVTKAGPAFLGGMKWGVGHSIGMLTFLVLFIPLQQLINMDLWEYYGNYIAGALLVGIGIYFAMNEKQYLELGSDGTWVPKQDNCSCCNGFSTPILTTHGHSTEHGSCSDECGTCDNSQKHDVDADAENAPLLPKEEKTNLLEKTICLKSMSVPVIGDLRGVLIGGLQGLCCPSCIAGLAFVGQMGAQHPSYLDIGIFFVVCFASLVIFSGIISCGIVAFSKSFTMCFSMSTRTLFRAACLFSVATGIVWIVLNARGQLDVIQFTHPMEAKLNGMSAPDSAMNQMSMGHMHMR